MLGHPLAKFALEVASVAGRTGAATHHESKHRLALDLVLSSDDRGFRDARMRDKCGLDFHRAESMAGDVQHVVDPTHDPEVSVGITMRTVARHVEAVVEFLPVRLQVALVVSPDRAQHRWPGLADDEFSAFAVGHFLAAVIHDGGIDAKEGEGGGARFERRGAG